MTIPRIETWKDRLTDEAGGRPAGRVRAWFRRHWGEKPLKLYLGLLAVAGGLPMFLFAILLLVQLQSAARQSESTAVVNRVDAIRSRLDRDLDGALQLVVVLARSEALRRQDYESFYQEASSVAARAGGWLILADAETLDQQLNTLMPLGSSLPKTAAAEEARDALTSGQPKVSHVFMGKVSKQWVFDIIQPVVSHDQVRWVLSLAFPAARLRDQIQEAQLPVGWIASIADSRGHVVARFPGHEAFVGHSETFPKIPESTAFTVTNDNVDGLLAMSRSQLADWRVFVWVPDAVVRAPFRRLWVWLLPIGITLLLLGVAVALGASRWLQRQIDDVAAAAGAIGSGVLPRPETTPLREANTVRKALVAASAKIAAARENEVRLATVTMASGEAVFSLTREGIIESWNPAAETLFGYRAEEAIGQPELILVPPGQMQEHGEVLGRVVAGERRVMVETERCRKGGECFPVAITLAPIRDELDRVRAFVSVARDITERKAREDQVELLIRELSHRTKNLLAVIQSLARQTGQNCPTIAVFLERFGSRLQAYAATHDALVNRDWKGASLRDIISRQIDPLLPKAADRYTVDGPSLLLNSGAAESIGLALHELAINATKYGALSNPTGRVRISWWTEETGEDCAFVMEWLEAGGPVVAPPATRGFGSVVVTDMLKHRSGGEVTLTFAPEGVHWKLRGPCERLLSTTAEDD